MSSGRWCETLKKEEERREGVEMSRVRRGGVASWRLIGWDYLCIQRVLVHDERDCEWEAAVS